MNAFVWVLAPLLTADCLSSERRQGTLGILLLTPMHPVDVVLSKWVVHGWQAAWIYLAVLPVLVLPVLVGGLSWIEGLHTAMVDTSALLLALIAGLVASSLWDGQRAVLIGAACIAFGFAVVLAAAWAVGFAVSQSATAGATGSLASLLPAAWRDFELTWAHAIAVG